jgi:hypothetical protein
MIRARDTALLVLAALAIGCAGDRRRSPACGLALVAAPTLILQRLTDLRAVLTDAPRGLPERLPARVVGTRQGEVLVSYDEQRLVLGYQGAAFPSDTQYAFGLLIVDDTTQRAVGVLIYGSSEVPRPYPRLGTVTGDGTTVLGLYGLRLAWADVSNPRCPLLGDTTSAR